jgi:excisionase family DNA binding protein
MSFPPFNSVDDTAAVLGLNRKTIYDAIARGEIPATRIGRALRVPGAWLQRMAEAREPSPPAAA